MTCTFFGHQDAPDDLLPKLEAMVLDLFNKKGVDFFYIGNNGRFDYLAQKTLERICREGKAIGYAIVLSSLRERAMNGMQNKTIFPEQIAVSPPRYAVYKRNEWMLNRSEYLIAYVKYQTSNSYQWMQRAEKKGLRVCNLGNEKEK